MRKKQIIKLLNLTDRTIIFNLVSFIFIITLSSSSMSSYPIKLHLTKMSKLITFVRNFNIPQEQLKTLVKFSIQGNDIGLMKPSFADLLINNFSDIFTRTGHQVVTFKEDIESSDMSTRSEVMTKVTASLRDKGVIKGWRNELFPLTTSFSSSPLLLLERAACPLFGVKAYGVVV